jgi:flagellar biosynthesis/type III secretory pathway M-ring protein FliF/YscJ
MNSTAGIIFALLSFVATFALARFLGRGIRKRRAEKALQEVHKQQSRQVRRARERKAR